MKTDPIRLAANAKGPLSLLKRTRTILQRYGLTPGKLTSALQLFGRLLDRFDCGATLPITAVVMERNPNWITQFADQNLEFAVHGYTHLDYTQLSQDQILNHFVLAREVFCRAGIEATGFRSPYLRRSPALRAAIQSAGFSYSSNEPILWAVLDESDLEPSALSSYRRALDFYESLEAGKHPSLPVMRDGVVDIPVSLPDDEILLDRLETQPGNGLVQTAWRQILLRSHELGELFTLQLHPERIALCADALTAVLEASRQLKSQVWLARLDEIATWWRERSAAIAEVREVEGGTWQISVSGPPGVTVLARHVDMPGTAEPWADGFWTLGGSAPIVRSSVRPIIGVSPACPPALNDFLREVGYIFQVDAQGRNYGYYVDATRFEPEARRPLLADIENSSGPLVRLGRWPGGARSALSITGDIDALTIWDYAQRLQGR